MTEYSDIVPELAPCFLMSPDSVAWFIPPGSITYYMVVFDEASQIEAAESIGALGRARSVIVVVDTRQMPPSQFGGRSAPDLDVKPDTDEEAVLEDLESILSEGVESNLQRLYLECHYRSRHKALIPFSNHHLYENRLTTFPSPAGPDATPISWHRLDVHFDRTSKGELLRTNVVGAEAIVADILQRVHGAATEHESIGVVTLNVQQQAMIVRLLEETGDERVKALLEDEGEGGLIVRNLESVQGDERDVTMLSIAFSPPTVVADDGSEARGRLPLHFGPLINKGDERRLNVAVTRARSEVVVYCSFDLEEMRLKGNSALGLQLLRTYLLDARDGNARSGDLVGRAPTPPDLHRGELADALRERGLKVRENVGLSDFRSDLAVGRAEDDDWSVAVLLDGPGWATRATGYDRDALPASVPHGAMGWRRVERVWFPMWLNARDEVLADIERAVELAVIPPEVDVLPEAELSPRPDPSAEQRPQLAESAESSEPAVHGTAAPSLAAAFDGAGQTREHQKTEPVSPPSQPELVALGGQEVLDQLDDRASRQLVEHAIADSLKIPTPMAAQPFAKTVAARFGYSRLTQARAETILALVPRELHRKDSLGEFIWPSELDAATWAGYVTAEEPGGARPVDQVAPEEITNAMVDLVRQGLEISEDELMRLTVDVFGSKRLTAGVRSRLEEIINRTVTAGKLERAGDSLRLPSGSEA